MSTPFWINKPEILFKSSDITQLWPLGTMTSEEKLNAITRLVILLTILGYLLTMSLKMIVIGIITIVCIVSLYVVQSNKTSEKNKKKMKENFTNYSEVYPIFTNPKTYKEYKNSFSKPSKANPFMNTLLPEINYDPKRKISSPTFNEEVEEKMNKCVQSMVDEKFDDPKIKDRLFNDLGDAFVFDRSMLPFYSSPAISQVPNDQGSFADFCYGSMISGKEGNALALQRNNGGAYNYTFY